MYPLSGVTSPCRASRSRSSGSAFSHDQCVPGASYHVVCIASCRSALASLAPSYQELLTSNADSLIRVQAVQLLTFRVAPMASSTVREAEASRRTTPTTDVETKSGDARIPNVHFSHSERIISVRTLPSKDKGPPRNITVRGPIPIMVEVPIVVSHCEDNWLSHSCKTSVAC